jgi:putative ABC transport system ATP-binding protein
LEELNENKAGSLIRLNALSKVYRTESIETAALAEVDVDICQGDFVAVTGPSGCGKSTLMNLIGLLDSPSSGSYRFLGEELAETPESRLAEVRRQHIAFIFQNFNLIDELNVRENVEFALLFHDVSAAERRRRATEIMERMGIAHRAGHKPSQLSGGQQQRVAVARALISEPTLILADEPAGNLDSQNGSEVMELLRTLNEEGATILMVTHSAEHARIAKREISLADGRVIAERIHQETHH